MNVGVITVNKKQEDVLKTLQKLHVINCKFIDSYYYKFSSRHQCNLFDVSGPGFIVLRLQEAYHRGAFVSADGDDRKRYEDIWRGVNQFSEAS